MSAMLELLKMFTSDVLYTLIVPGFFVGGGLLLIAQFIPDLLKQYKLPAQLTGIFLILFFTFQSGKYTEYTSWHTKELEMQAQIALLEAKSTQITVETVTEFVDKIKNVDRWKEVKVYEFIPAEVNNACVIDSNTANNIRLLINDSHSGKVPPTPINLTGTTSKASGVN